MKILLLTDVEKLGKKGEVVEVRDGYARNYLIPKGLAIQATPSVIKHFQDINRIKEEVKQKRIIKLQTIAEKINRLTYKASLKGGKEGYFGSITDEEIVEFLKSKGINIDKKQIELDEPIRTPGVYDIKIALGEGISGILKVWVVKKEEK
ncbi:MAG: 50S ribosomal protein L9 [candidate division WOR-3 bacterium]|nr:50S ribosomal protein L9 [candidate division WOR-3 bacterium]MCX7836909.1 50S ribosomal protein L9 [candidate division WOR-3 bacterium]